MGESGIYLNAAAGLAGGYGDAFAREFSCSAIDHAMHGLDPERVQKRYVALFEPTRKEFQLDWSDEPEVRLQMAFEECYAPKQVRILALCFMAAIAEDEERSAKRRVAKR